MGIAIGGVLDAGRPMIYEPIVTFNGFGKSKKSCWLGDKHKFRT